MVGYIGSKAAVTQVDGYSKSEADDRYVEGDDTLYVDQTNNRVGIGTIFPAATLDVSDSTVSTIRSTSGSYNLTGYQYASGFAYLLTNGQLEIGTIGANILALKTNNTERMRIDSNGRLLLRKTSGVTTDSCIEMERDMSSGVAMEINNTASLGTHNAVHFRYGGSVVGKITVGTSSTGYVTSSDHRLKENVTGISDGITRVKQLAPKRFNFIADADTTVDGFLAHEAQAVVPEAVTGTHNEVDADGNAVMQGIDQGKLVPLLTAALQEAITKIETLETKVAALEAG